MTTTKNTLALGFIDAAPVEKGPFANVMLIAGDEAIEGTAYIATDDKGTPVSLSIRVLLDDTVTIGLLRQYVPIRGKVWQWGDGTTQPLGGGRSRWTVGGPKVTTTKPPVPRGAVASGPGPRNLGSLMAEAGRTSKRGKLSAAHRAIGAEFGFDSDAQLRALDEALNR